MSTYPFDDEYSLAENPENAIPEVSHRWHWPLRILDRLPNGSIVIEAISWSERRGTEVGVVLCHLPHNDVDKYATWSYGLSEISGQVETFNGHYFPTIWAAAQDLATRAGVKNT